MNLQEINTLQYEAEDLALNIIQIKEQIVSNGKSDELFKTIETCKNRAEEIVTGRKKLLIRFIKHLVILNLNLFSSYYAKCPE